MNRNIEGPRDKLHGDESFLAPFRQKFGTAIGRPTRAYDVSEIPLSIRLRRLGNGGQGQLCLETRFYHLSLDATVPDSMTLIKLTHKYDEGTVKALNEAPVRKLKESRVVRGKKIRIHTTVVEFDIHSQPYTGCSTTASW